MTPTTTSTSDPLRTLAAELGRIGRRLDDMGVELLALREPEPESDSADVAPADPTRAGPAAVPPAATDLTVPVRQARVSAGHPDPPPSGGWPPAGAGHPRGPAPVTGRPQAPAAQAGRIAPAWQAAGPPAGLGDPYWGAPPAGLGPAPAAVAPIVGHGPAAQFGWASAGRTPPPPGVPVPPGPQGGWGAPPPGAPDRKRPALTGARLMAWTGGGVTLLGVVMLLVLAASRGWFTPQARVVFGAVLGAALVGLGMRLHRRETARSGALALVATGFATLYLVDVAATAFYDYLPAALGLALALVVAGAGLGIADRWRTQLLACGVVGGAAVLAPFLAHGWLLTALALALQVAALPVVLRRGWTALVLLAAAGPVLYGLVALVTENSTAVDVPVTVGIAAAVLLVAVATALLVVRRSAGPRDTSVPVGAGAAVIATAVLPALLGAVVLSGWGGALLAVGAALVLGVPVLLSSIPRAVKVAAGTSATVALFTATVVGLNGSAAELAVLGEALVAALLAVGLRSRFAMVTALVLGGWGSLLAVGRYAPLPSLVEFAIAPPVADLVTAVAVAVLLVALAAALLVAGGRLVWVVPDASRAAVWVPIGLVGLYGATGAVVDAALLVSPTASGFTAGHAVVTVSWTVGALLLLARGLRRPALRITGLVLVAAAVAKLVLFDLVALDGLARVAAFIGAGLVLLAAGTRYARLVAEAEQAPSSGPSGPSGMSGPSGPPTG